MYPVIRIINFNDGTNSDVKRLEFALRSEAKKAYEDICLMLMVHGLTKPNMRSINVFYGNSSAKNGQTYEEQTFTI